MEKLNKNEVMGKYHVSTEADLEYAAIAKALTKDFYPVFSESAICGKAQIQVHRNAKVQSMGFF